MIQLLSQEKKYELKQRIENLEIYPYIKTFYNTGQIPIRYCLQGDCISDASGTDYHIIYILEGSIKIFSLTYKGRRILLDEVDTGSFSGHISRMRGYNFDSNIVAGTPCIYLEFTDKIFKKLMLNKDFALLFYQSTSQRTYHMYRKILSLSLFSLEENTAFYFITHQNLIKGLTLETISEEIGLSRRSLCYIIRRWKQQGVISRETGSYKITDMDALHNISQNIEDFYNSVL